VVMKLVLAALVAVSVEGTRMGRLQKAIDHASALPALHESIAAPNKAGPALFATTPVSASKRKSMQSVAQIQKDLSSHYMDPVYDETILLEMEPTIKRTWLHPTTPISSAQRQSMQSVAQLKKDLSDHYMDPVYDEAVLLELEKPAITQRPQLHTTAPMSAKARNALSAPILLESDELLGEDFDMPTYVEKAL
jgi:hypothetical protein